MHYKYSALSCSALFYNLTAAVQNDGGNECKDDRSCWSAAETKYTEFPLCTSDYDCQENHYCLKHMWTYNEQIENGQGCVRKAVCAGNGNWIMLSERTIQFFCSEDQLAENQGKEPIWGLEPSPTLEWEEYR